jgi:hypothetical protein
MRSIPHTGPASGFPAPGDPDSTRERAVPVKDRDVPQERGVRADGARPLPPDTERFAVEDQA